MGQNRVTVGQAFVPNADFHNDTVETVEDHRMGRLSGNKRNPRILGPLPDVVVRNGTGAALGPYSVLGLSGLTPGHELPDDRYPGDMEKAPCVFGAQYDKPVHAQKIVVVVDGVAAGQLQRGYTGGHIWVPVTCNQRVAYLDVEGNQFTPKEGGGWRVLAQTRLPQDTSRVWCYINLSDQPNHDHFLVESTEAITAATYDLSTGTSESSSGSETGSCVVPGRGFVKHCVINDGLVEAVQLNGEDVVENIYNMTAEGMPCGQYAMAVRDAFGDLHIAEVYGNCPCPDGSSSGSSSFGSSSSDSESGSSGSGSSGSGGQCVIPIRRLECSDTQICVYVTNYTLQIVNGELVCSEDQETLEHCCELCCDESSSGSGGGGGSEDCGTCVVTWNGSSWDETTECTGNVPGGNGDPTGVCLCPPQSDAGTAIGETRTLDCQTQVQGLPVELFMLQAIANTASVAPGATLDFDSIEAVSEVAYTIEGNGQIHINHDGLYRVKLNYTSASDDGIVSCRLMASDIQVAKVSAPPNSTASVEKLIGLAYGQMISLIADGDSDFNASDVTLILERVR